ncbi:serine hydrolase domain-containing protein [Lutimonas sp.]|uniref:serine hydrolase domain-containing protein n=1 Tax=Lutimonas sp. TaxID=1872403 RepID=UPI003D9B0F78
MKKWLKYFLFLLLAGIAILVYIYYPALNIVTGYSSKNMASGIFVTERDQTSLMEYDNGFFPISLADYDVNIEEKSVTSSLFGLMKRKAIYYEGVGAVLVNKDEDALTSVIAPIRVQQSLNMPYPYGKLQQKDTLFEEVNYQYLESAVDNAFDKEGEQLKQTRSVLVVYKDQIIAEKYEAGFDKESLMHGWSMTKSFTSTIYGLLQRQRGLDLTGTTGLEQWKADERKDITYQNLLEMNSGLEWEEAYFNISDVTKMLYLAADMGAMQIDKPLTGTPDESWNYSSGTSNLLSGPLLRAQFNSHQEYLDFWYTELLDKIGMHSAVVEVDQVGNYVGSSYAWATTRDWAKFGLLYLHEGNWNGEQVLDSSFVKYVATPTNSSEGRYGAQFWLNAGAYFPDVPADMYYCSGFKGQYVFIFPSQNLIVVRTGLTGDPTFNVNEFLKEIIASIS